MQSYSDLLAQISELRKTVAALELAEQKNREQLNALRQRYADDLFAERQLVRQLREDRHRIQQDYERLRVQKGGFGLKMLTLSGLSGFVSALLLCVAYAYFFQPKSEVLAAFEHFRDAHLFNYERLLCAGHLKEVETHLAESARAPENGAIRPYLEFSRKLITATQQNCQ